MSGGLSVSLIGGEKVVAALENVASKNHRKMITAVYASAFRIQAAARLNLTNSGAVDTGRLRSSVFVRFLDGGLSAEVGTDVFYGPFIEYGTVNTARKAQAFVGPMMPVKGAGVGPAMPGARPFLGPAYAVELPRFVKRIKTILGEK